MVTKPVMDSSFREMFLENWSLSPVFACPFFLFGHVFA